MSRPNHPKEVTVSNANCVHRRRARKRAGPLPPGPVLGHLGGIPIVPVTVRRYYWGTQFVLAACPYCGAEHLHGGGDPGDDPHDHEGHRLSHCVRRVPGDRGYILRITGGELAR